MIKFPLFTQYIFKSNYVYRSLWKVFESLQILSSIKNSKEKQFTKSKYIFTTMLMEIHTWKILKWLLKYFLYLQKSGQPDLTFFNLKNVFNKIWQSQTFLPVTTELFTFLNEQKKWSSKLQNFFIWTAKNQI